MVPISKEVLDKIEMKKLLTKIKDTKFDTLTLEQLRGIVKSINE